MNLNFLRNWGFHPTVSHHVFMPIGVRTTAKGFIHIFNPVAERMLGYTAAKVMNKLFLCTALKATESLRSTREDQK